MPPTLRVASLQPDESAEVATLVERVVSALPYYSERAKREELAKYTTAELSAMAAADPHGVLVAHHEGSIAGFCISRYDDGLVWLAWFGADSAHRRLGIGRALLQALATTLPERHAHKIWCDTRTENHTSQQVLKQCGFRRIAELRNHWYEQDFYLWEWVPEQPA